MTAKPNFITRALIDVTVDRGLREIEEDPKRSIRKLADLGHQFSKGRFMENLYDMFQDLLRNDDSPYYTAISLLLRNTTRQHLKDFGINFGYNGLTCGGKTIRSEGPKKEFDLPWILTIRYNPALKNSLTLHEIDSCISQGKELGIYVFMIRLTGPITEFRDLQELFQRNNDCSFMVFLNDQILTEEQFQSMKACTNVMTLLPFHSSNTLGNTEILRKKKILYGIYSMYNDDNAIGWLNEQETEKLLPFKSVFNILIASEECSQKTRDAISSYCRMFRMHPTHPFILFDMISDINQIGNLISPGKHYFELLENGDIRTEYETISDFRHTTSLEQILSIALPKKEQ